MNIDIIYEDNHIIVLNKGRGQLSQADKTGEENLINEIKKYLIIKYKKKGDAFLGMVQRLDRVTSGVIVYAKTSKAASRLTKAFMENKVDKIYIAVVSGILNKKEGVLKDYLIKNRELNISSVVNNKEKGKYAELKYKVISEKNGFSLIMIKLITGRSHQIRVQFSSRGITIAGDKKYRDKHYLQSGIALHSFAINLEHPVKKESMRFYALPPNDEYFDLFKNELQQIQNDGGLI